MEDLEKLSFVIIANSGNARSYAYSALDAAKQKNYEKADQLLNKSNEASILAHEAQTTLVANKINDDNATVDILFVHAQDHLMNSMLAVELIKEMIGLYKKIQ